LTGGHFVVDNAPPKAGSQTNLPCRFRQLIITTKTALNFCWRCQTREAAKPYIKPLSL